jgi:hypothetical protein
MTNQLAAPPTNQLQKMKKILCNQTIYFISKLTRKKEQLVYVIFIYRNNFDKDKNLSSQQIYSTF